MKSYLKAFNLPGYERESDHFFGRHDLAIYDTLYPFDVLPKKLTELQFAPVTILYGGNGSGKTTILNVIAEKLKIPRKTKYNRSTFFDEYIDLCDFSMRERALVAKIITSDEVFDKIFEIRDKNEMIDSLRDKMLEQRSEYRGAVLRDLLGDGDSRDYADKLSEILDARTKTRTTYVRERVARNIREKSNGEAAIDFFVREINDEGLYLLDEPENSLSASYQRELAAYLMDSARFFGAQLIIATHSPFMLSLPEAVIYNLDTDPVSVTSDWTTLENMRVYYDFFRGYNDKFEK